MSAPGAAVARSNLPGIVAMVAGIFCLATMDALAKYLGETYPIVQIVFFRSLFVLPMAVVMAWLSAGGLASLKTRRPWVHLVRGVLTTAAIVTFFTALRFLPLAEVWTIAFASPLLVTALSVPVLGEPVGWRRWSAVLVGFAGVLIVVQPGMSAFQPAALIALLAAVCYALILITARKYAESESTPSLVFWSGLVPVVVSGAVLPFHWTMPATGELHWFLVIGVLGGFAMLLLTQAFRLAPAAVVAPFDYTAMIWSVGWGWLIWQDVPRPTTWIGGAVIIVAGLYIMHRETRLARAAYRRPTDQATVG